MIGPSGSGKSTLLAAIAGFVDPAARPRPLGRPRHHRIAARRAAADAALPGAQPLRPPERRPERRPRPPPGPAARPRRLGAGRCRPSPRSASKAWARVVRRSSPVASASGSPSPARCCAHRPLLLLDEPFAALGPALRAEMLDLVARIRAEQEATLVLVTHAPGDARRIADQVVLVDGYRAHPPAPTEALFADPPPELRAYLGASTPPRGSATPSAVAVREARDALREHARRWTASSPRRRRPSAARWQISAGTAPEDSRPA